MKLHYTRPNVHYTSTCCRFVVQTVVRQMHSESKRVEFWPHSLCCTATPDTSHTTDIFMISCCRCSYEHIKPWPCTSRGVWSTGLPLNRRLGCNLQMHFSAESSPTPISHSPLNDLSKGQECDRKTDRPRLGEMCRNRQNRI